MSTFRSFVIKENNGAIVKDVILENTENLPAGDVLIKVMYSTINSYDVLFSRENTPFRNKSVLCLLRPSPQGIQPRSYSKKREGQDRKPDDNQEECRSLQRTRRKTSRMRDLFNHIERRLKACSRIQKGRKPPLCNPCPRI